MFFFFSSRRRHTRCSRDWSSDVCSSDLSTFHPQKRAPVLPVPLLVCVAQDFVGHLAVDHETGLTEQDALRGTDPKGCTVGGKTAHPNALPGSILQPILLEEASGGLFRRSPPFRTRARSR